MIRSQLILVLLLINYACAFATDRSMLGITGGYKIAISEAPFVASMVRYMEKITDHIARLHVCGGSIIHERFILTAAHCLFGQSFRDVIRVGSSELYAGGITYEVEKFIIHENFTERNGYSAFAYDVALIKLKENINFNENISKIALAEEGLKMGPHTLVNITGWGKIESYGQVSKELRQVLVEIKPTDECEMYPWMSVDEICVWTHHKGSCKGDSGGPVTLGDLQVGIVSNGYGCGYFPGINTKVSFLWSWIMDTVNKNM